MIAPATNQIARLLRIVLSFIARSRSRGSTSPCSGSERPWLRLRGSCVPRFRAPPRRTHRLLPASSAPLGDDRPQGGVEDVGSVRATHGAGMVGSRRRPRPAALPRGTDRLRVLGGASDHRPEPDPGGGRRYADARRRGRRPARAPAPIRSRQSRARRVRAAPPRPGWPRAGAGSALATGSARHCMRR
jgi:hypothetical protein